LVKNSVMYFMDSPQMAHMADDKDASMHQHTIYCC